MLILAGQATRAASLPDDDGWRAYDAGNFDEALRLWTAEVERGIPAAAFGLGLAYDLGIGASQDSARACAWYRRAGEAGYASAEFNIAIMYDNALCGPRRPDEAATWYARAAARGHPRAQYDLAQLYETGDGLPLNPGQAAIWYQLAQGGGIEASGAKLAALAGVRSARVEGPLQPALPMAPRGETRVWSGGNTVSVALVWGAPQEPAPVRFFVQLIALDPAGPREVLGKFTDQSATAVDLTNVNASYAWRVVSVSPSMQHYVTSAWMTFQTLRGTDR